MDRFSVTGQNMRPWQEGRPDIANNEVPMRQHECYESAFDTSCPIPLGSPIWQSLVNWVGRSAPRIGPERVYAIMELFRISGYLGEDVERALIGLPCMNAGLSPQHKVSSRDSLDAFRQLCGLLAARRDPYL